MQNLTCAPVTHSNWSIMQALTQKHDSFDNTPDAMDFDHMNMATSTSPEYTEK